MVKKLSALLAVLLLSFAINPSVITQAQGTESSAIQQEKSEDITAEARAEQRQARIDEAKEQISVKLNQAEQRKIEGACKSAQVVVDQLQSRVNGVVESRQTKYTEFSTNLSSLSEKLKSAGQDTTELNSVITEFQSTVTGSVSSLQSYSTSLTDISSVDCQSDPAGFKAILEQARIQRTTLKENADQVKNYLKDTLKPLLEKTRLNLNSTEGGN